MLHSLWLPKGCINSKHCLPLCATGLEVGDNSVEKMLFSKTILSHSTTPYLGYFLCILVVRFLMWEHLSQPSKVCQTTKADFIPWQKRPIFQLFITHLLWILSITTLSVFTVFFACWQLRYSRRNQACKSTIRIALCFQMDDKHGWMDDKLYPEQMSRWVALLHYMLFFHCPSSLFETLATFCDLGMFATVFCSAETSCWTIPWVYIAFFENSMKSTVAIIT